MLCVKETVRLYKTKDNANHGVGALRRHGWQIREAPVERVLEKGKHVWEVRGVRGLSILIRLYDAYMAARTVIGKKIAAA